MRVNHPVTQLEYELAPDAALVSRTDLKGRITYANRASVEVSGFSMDELMGRHGPARRTSQALKKKDPVSKLAMAGAGARDWTAF